MSPQPSRLLLAACTIALSVGLAVSARAQGTAEQREACTPDALKLCQNTIPDIPRTTACMKRHFAQLSPRCQTAFNGATGSSRQARSRGRIKESAAPRVSRREPDDDDVDVMDFEAPRVQVPGLWAYKAQIRRICRQGFVDSFTCRNTLDALKLSE